MAQNTHADWNSKEKTSAEEIHPLDMQFPILSQLDQTPVAQFTDRGPLGLGSVNHSNFANTRNARSALRS